MSWGKKNTAMLQEKYRKQGFSVLAFPIDDFRQELKSNKEIENFVHENFPQVDFPIFSLSSLPLNPGTLFLLLWILSNF
jgi:glutathione peroxidase-family protein